LENVPGLFRTALFFGNFAAASGKAFRVMTVNPEVNDGNMVIDG
jgi:hypothetical protein